MNSPTSPESDSTPPVLAVFFYLVLDPFGDGSHVTGVFATTEVRVRVWFEDSVVGFRGESDVPAEFLQLVYETKLDETDGAFFHSCFWLTAVKSDTG